MHKYKEYSRSQFISSISYDSISSFLEAEHQCKNCYVQVKHRKLSHVSYRIHLWSGIGGGLDAIDDSIKDNVVSERYVDFERYANRAAALEFMVNHDLVPERELLRSKVKILESIVQYQLAGVIIRKENETDIPDDISTRILPVMSVTTDAQWHDNQIVPDESRFHSITTATTANIDVLTQSKQLEQIQTEHNETVNRLIHEIKVQQIQNSVQNDTIRILTQQVQQLQHANNDLQDDLLQIRILLKKQNVALVEYKAHGNDDMAIKSHRTVNTTSIDDETCFDTAIKSSNDTLMIQYLQKELDHCKKQLLDQAKYQEHQAQAQEEAIAIATAAVAAAENRERIMQQKYDMISRSFQELLLRYEKQETQQQRSMEDDCDLLSIIDDISLVERHCDVTSNSTINDIKLNSRSRSTPPCNQGYSLLQQSEANVAIGTELTDMTPMFYDARSDSTQVEELPTNDVEGSDRTSIMVAVIPSTASSSINKTSLETNFIDISKEKYVQRSKNSEFQRPISQVIPLRHKWRKRLDRVINRIQPFFTKWTPSVRRFNNIWKDRNDN